MSGDGGVTSRTSQIFAIFVRDVLTLAILVAFGQTEVNNVDVIARGVSSTNQKVIRLDIAVNYTFFVNFLDTFDELDGDHEHSLEVEITLARLE